METVHMFICINRKCKHYRKEQHRDLTKFDSNTRCSSCKKIMRYLGEQGKLFADRAKEMDLPSTREEKDLTHAVFCVENSKRAFCDGTKPICHMEYVCLQNGLSRGAALPLLTKRVSDYHRSSTVKFMFWADSYVGSGPSPVYITMKNNKIKEDK